MNKFHMIFPESPYRISPAAEGKSLNFDQIQAAKKATKKDKKTLANERYRKREEGYARLGADGEYYRMIDDRDREERRERRRAARRVR